MSHRRLQPASHKRPATRAIKPGNGPASGASRKAPRAAAGSTGFRLDSLDWTAVALIVLLAAIPRLLFLFALPPVLHLDSDSYFTIAQKLWAGSGFGDLSRRTPLYPLLLAAAGHSARAGLFLVVAIQHVLGVGSAVLCYLFARRLFFPKYRGIAIASGLLAGFVAYPALLEQSILSESLYTFLLMAAAYFLLAWFRESRNRQALACGALLGLAALTRPVGAGLFPLWAALLFPLCGVRKASRFLLWGGGAFLLLLPLLIRNELAMGRFALTESLGRNLISVTDRFVDYDHGVQLQVKSIYRSFLKDKRGPDAVVVYSAMPRLRRATHWTDVRIDGALAAIAWEAIRAHPLPFIASRLRRLPLLLRDPAPSQQYALHAETYLPLLEFLGSINPGMVSRSIAFPGLRHTRFGLSRWAYRIFAVDLTSGWLIVFPLIGIGGTLLVERREGRGPSGWLWAGLLAYAWIGTILVQPPNARYRLPTLSFELLFAVAGYYFTAKILAGIWEKTAARFRAHKGPGRPGVAALISQPLWKSGTLAGRSSRALVTAIVVAVLAILTARALPAGEAAPAFTISDWKPKAGATASGTGQAIEIRELPMAGKKIKVLYWAGGSAGASHTISADVPVAGGLPYRLLAAYSCQTRDCAGALIRVSFLNAAGTLLGPGHTGWSEPLAHERADNDLFWDQIDEKFEAPAAARAARVELAVGSRKGSLVAPQLSIQPAPTLLNLWRMGAGGAIRFAAAWAALAAAAAVALMTGGAASSGGDGAPLL